MSSNLQPNEKIPSNTEPESNVTEQQPSQKIHETQESKPKPKHFKSVSEIVNQFKDNMNLPLEEQMALNKEIMEKMS